MAARSLRESAQSRRGHPLVFGRRILRLSFGAPRIERHNPLSRGFTARFCLHAAPSVIRKAAEHDSWLTPIHTRRKCDRSQISLLNALLSYFDLCNRFCCLASCRESLADRHRKTVFRREQGHANGGVCARLIRLVSGGVRQCRGRIGFAEGIVHELKIGARFV
jgi:hypothetical protein